MVNVGDVVPLSAEPDVSSVAAVVVTHRRPRLATQVVRGLLMEERLAPEQIFVVVNGEGGLEDAELASAVHMVQLAENLGPAAGFREGMLAAAAIAPYEWYYLCEDDIGLFNLPTPRLTRLLRELEHLDVPPSSRQVGAVVAYGRDLNRRTGHASVHAVSCSSGFDVVDAASWGATLVHRRVLDAGILPVDDYFFGYEDFDFFYRLRKAGLQLLLDRRAAASVADQMSLSGRDEAFHGIRPLDTDEPWRAFYVARNLFLLARRYGTVGWVLAHLAYSIRSIQLAHSAEERRAILRGLIAGALGRRGKDPRFLREQGELDFGPAAPTVTSPGKPHQDTTRYVLHVLPYDAARGAQVVARDLRELLGQESERHEILTMFASEPVFLSAEHRLDVQMGGRRALGFDPLAFLRLRAALRRLRPDVVVAHGGEPLKYLALTARRAAPVVYVALGVVTEAARKGARRSLYQVLMNRAELVVCVSKETRDEARDLFGVPAERLVLVPNSRDPEVYRPVETERTSGSPLKLIFVGHLTDTKRPSLFVSAVAELRRKGCEVVGEVVGDGPLEAEVRRTAVDAGVSVLGRRTDVASLLPAADVFVFTSVPESEGMPGVLIEAGMAGLPVVATDCPGVSAVVADGETGFVVGVEDFDGLIAALERLVDDATLRRRMGRAARQRCVGEFSLEASGAHWTEVFDRLAPRHQRS